MIELKHVTKIIGKTVILDDVNLQVDTGEFVFLVGPSGCGKTTIFKLLIAADRLNAGEINIDGYNITKINASKVPALRKQVAVVFQDFKLIPNKNVWENISFVLELQGMHAKDRKKRIMELLDLVGLADKIGSFPSQLSGGEKQRIAIARAMATDPSILLADEPTGNLDFENTLEVISILKKINSLGTTIILATHEIDVVASMDARVIEMSKGRVIDETQRSIQYVKKLEKYKNLSYNSLDNGMIVEKRDAFSGDNKYNANLSPKENDVTDLPKEEYSQWDQNQSRKESIDILAEDIYQASSQKEDEPRLMEIKSEMEDSKDNNKFSNIDTADERIPTISNPFTSRRIQVITKTGIEVIEKQDKETEKKSDHVMDKENRERRDESDNKRKEPEIVSSKNKGVVYEKPDLSHLNDSKIEEIHFPSAIEEKLLKNEIRYLSEIEKLSEYELAQLVGALNVWKTVQTIRRFKHQYKL